jgi:DUF2971 family protein
MNNPDRLYHFTTAKYALDDLRNKHLKIAQFDDLNDPFELKSVNLCDPVQAQAFDGIEELGFEGFKATIARRFGVLCFSEEKTDVLQWSHYADRHKGICLGFNVTGSQGKFGRVHYETEQFPFPQKPDVDFSWKLLSTKSSVWEYEKEWRVFLGLNDGVWNESAGRVLYFAEFGSELVLQEVILGAASKTSVSDVLQAMHGYRETVLVSRMRLSCDKFELQEKPVGREDGQTPALELNR